ncbi:hypothetical protein JR316_0010978 [Psilocybe cubensis]|uniref:F-box domain-containing protein n=2 Tax=Psilocybe cubensis TaxID=181762 RepID=A0A8H7XPY9_PSICU|nr:hypothetical protein JR316_0010978 [Psilocybe cubensis]KAH9477062.1 hypothetical protein JR316_0010978 [Psilocybe cubensis]
MAPTLNIPDSLLRLAPEIILAIGNELGLPDIKRFRLSCKAVAAILHHEVFRTVHLEVCKENMVKGVRKIEALAAGKHPACAAARVLSIGMLAPAASRAVLASTIWSPSPYPEETSEAADARKRLAAHLFDAITSLRGVNSVIWEEHEHDCYPASRIAMNAIKELPSLRSVRFRFESWPQIPLELDCLNDLTEISIKTGVAFPPYAELIFDNVAKAIAQNPNLRSIDICNTGIDHLHAYNSLHNLFRLYPRTAPPLGLVNLKLKSVNLCLDDAVVMRHLISLKSISLEDIHPHPSHTSLFYTSLPSDVWRVLDSNGIHLEEITLDEAPPSFIDYLSSYSGLKRLRFIDNPCKPADGTADLFFEKALLGHAQSLECLEIVPPYPEGRWCFSGSNSGRFSIFSKLKHLAVNFQLSDLQDFDHVGEKRSSSPLDPFVSKINTLNHFTRSDSTP